MTTRPRPSGFTGFELLIVIVLVGLLAWLVVSRFNSLATISRDTERRVDANVMAAELEAFRADQGYYPPTVAELPSYPRPGADGATQVTPDSGALFDPDGQLTQDSPTASTNLPATGYSPDRPDGAQYTYAPYSCNPVELIDETETDEPKADETETAADETEAETEADGEAEVVFDRCQQYVIYAWLEGGGVYFKVSQAEVEPASEV